jgi:predicted dehydrogenase
MKTHNIGVIMNGVTGRMGTNQHLLRSLCAIRESGGIKVSDSEVIMPDPILVGRNRAKLEALAKRAKVDRVTTNLDEALADKANTVYFDAQLTQLRAPAVKKAIEAGLNVYCEKPSGTTTEEAYELYSLAKTAGVKQGVVQDKLWLPGLRKIATLSQSGFFGDILSIRGEFGYWVFTGLDGVAPQRPSWNYREEDGGGIIVDMLCHWRYVLDHLFGKVKSVSCLAATHVGQRADEDGKTYECTADDSAYASFQLESPSGKPIVAHFNSSWCVRVRRDDLLTLQVDGTKGSAVAGLRECWIQPHGATPRPTWNPDIAQPIDFYDGWLKVPEQDSFDNAFRVQWESFLRHVVLDEPWEYDLREGAKGVQLAELGLQSSRERRWMDVPDLPV